ncbi:MAG: hypothetical protein AAGC95_15315 [Pseudomonadota bacterium]
MRYISKIFLFIGLASIVGCETYTPIPFDRQAAGVENISMPGDILPDTAVVGQAASVGSSFGLIGALVDAGIQSNRQGRVKELFETHRYNPEASFTDKITSAVEERGFTLSVLNTERQKRDFLETYPASPAPVDAYLDIVALNYGFASAGVGVTWRPYITTKVKLVSAQDQSVLMDNQIIYNPIGATAKGIITISADPQYGFRDVNAMEADPERAMKGLDDAFEKVAETVATLLQ